MKLSAVIKYCFSLWNSLKSAKTCWRCDIQVCHIFMMDASDSLFFPVWPHVGTVGTLLLQKTQWKSKKVCLFHKKWRCTWGIDVDHTGLLPCVNQVTGISHTLSWKTLAISCWGCGAVTSKSRWVLKKCLVYPNAELQCVRCTV